LGSYKAPHFNGGCMDSPTSAEGGHVTTTMRYDRCMPREATPEKPGKPKARSRNGLAMLTSKAWRASLAHTDPGPSPHRAVGVDRPELKLPERAVALDEGGSPPL
jgi:hypothetical protein